MTNAERERRVADLLESATALAIFCQSVDEARCLRQLVFDAAARLRLANVALDAGLETKP